MPTNPRYVVDDKGSKLSVVLDIEEYEKILEELEELESVRAYDAAKASGEEPLPIHSALESIERSRK